MAALLILVLAPCLYALWSTARYRMLIQLKWPSRLSFLGMTALVSRYLKARGWRVQETVDVEFDFVVSNNGDNFGIFCRPTGYDIRPSLVIDVTETTTRHKLGLILLAAEPVDKHVMAYGLERGVFVLHYKSLNKLTALNPATPGALRELVIDLAYAK